jgi:hypothetical protein
MTKIPRETNLDAQERQIEHRLNEFYGADAAAPQLVRPRCSPWLVTC